MLLTAERPEKKSSFYPGFLCLPRNKRLALGAVYRFCREVDDAVDEGDATPAARAAELESWRRGVESLGSGAAPELPALRELAPWVSAFGLPKSALLAVIDGCAMDLRKSRYESFAELEPYLAGVASSVGALCAHVFGFRDPAALEYARLTGYAVQLSNILRDLKSDWSRGRLYIPLEDLRRFGVAQSDFGADAPGPAMRRLLAFEAGRARDFYRRAWEALPASERRNMAPGAIMAGVYERLLDKIEGSGFDVFTGRIGLTRWEKTAAAWKAYRRSRA